MRSVAEDSQGLPGIPLAGSRSIIEPCYRDGNNYELFVLSALRQAQGERGLGYGGLVAGNGRAPVRGELAPVRGEPVPVGGEPVEPNVAREY